MSKHTKDKKEIEQVGTISANNDENIGRLISEAMEKMGKEGVITVDEAKGEEKSGITIFKHAFAADRPKRTPGRVCRA